MPAAIRIELMGNFQVVCEGSEAVRFHPGRPAALLGYLATQFGRKISRDIVMEVLWPEVEETSGRNRLKQTLSVLRRQLGADESSLAEIIVTDRDFLSIDTSNVLVDVVQFESLLRTAESVTKDSERLPLLAQGLGLFRGEFLYGFYDDWILTERERLEGQRAEILRTLIPKLEAAGDVTTAINYARLWVKSDQLNEEAAGALIRLLLVSGNRQEAERQFRILERILRQELGIKPAPWIPALLEQIYVPPEPPPEPRHTPDRTVRNVLEPVGGAVPLNSKYYIVRQSDDVFKAAIAQRDSIVLIKGPRQVGKTSLLARGMNQAREIESCVVLLDLQKLNDAQLHSLDAFYLACAHKIADQLNLSVNVPNSWDSERGANDNFERFIRREVLAKIETHVVWALDEVDRLFPCAFSAEVFSLFRSWHNERSLDPTGLWSRLTLAIAYATEAHLFISDLNQSPFNVGTRLVLQDFTIKEVAELNRRYDGPLKDGLDITRFYDLLGGNPYLVRRGLNEIASSGLSLEAFEALSAREDGPFHDHLNRIVKCVQEDKYLVDALLEVLENDRCPSSDSFYRLRAAGVITGDSPDSCRPRCLLYTNYLARSLK
jgi:DNA-binding SARP family transcriptional activator